MTGLHGGDHPVAEVGCHVVHVIFIYLDTGGLVTVRETFHLLQRKEGVPFYDFFQVVIHLFAALEGTGKSGTDLKNIFFDEILIEFLSKNYLFKISSMALAFKNLQREAPMSV